MKCEFCECEWSLSPRYTKRLDCCPFCGEKLALPFIPYIEDLTTLSGILSAIGHRFGDDVLRDGNRTLAIFSDIAPLQVREKTMLTRLISCNGQADLYDARLLPSSEQAVIFRKVVNRIVEEQLVAESIALEVCSSYCCALTGQDPTTILSGNNSNQPIADNMQKGLTSTMSAKNTTLLESFNTQLIICEKYLFPSNGNKDFSRAALALKDHVANNTDYVTPLYYGITYLISKNPDMAKRFFQTVVLESPNPEVKRIAERAMTEYC